jgi:tRNA threonylcarbamoyladenosine biosynthesis protein TsaB
MSYILLIETSTVVCSAAIACKGNVVAIRESREKLSHAGQLTMFIESIMKETGISFNQLDAIAVSKGPGSYTGLRIGVSTAKGICYALDKPLIAIGTLVSMARGFVQSNRAMIGKNDLLCPMIDARRMEVYLSVFDSGLALIKETEAVVIDEHLFGQELDKQIIWFFGDGAPKCRGLLSNQPNVRIVDDFFPSSSFLAGMAEEAFNSKQFVDTAYFEPFYLKDFVAALPKVKGLR